MKVMSQNKSKFIRWLEGNNISSVFELILRSINEQWLIWYRIHILKQRLELCEHCFRLLNMDYFHGPGKTICWPCEDAIKRLMYNDKQKAYKVKVKPGVDTNIDRILCRNT